MTRLVKGSTPQCSIAKCDALAHGRGFCNRHYKRWKQYGDPEKRLIREAGEGTPHIEGYWFIKINGVSRLRHVLVAEKALGRPLPDGAEVHHVDENKCNDANNNLVICPSRSYHRLLHRRMKALTACGNADWVKCWRCGVYGPEEELHKNGGSFVHPTCYRQYTRSQRIKRLKEAA